MKVKVKSVRTSIRDMDSIGDFIWDSVHDSIYESIWGFISDSVWHSVGHFISCSVLDYANEG